jgi:hypothetical protein
MGRQYPHQVVITLEGAEECKALLTKWIEIAPDKVARVTREEMQDLMTESQKECPWDYNNAHEDGSMHLRDTAKVAQQLDANGVTTYGFYDTPYAVYVHEILEYHHLPPTKAKFLEDPVNRREKEWIPNIARKLDDFYEAFAKRQGARQLKAAGHLVGRFTGKSDVEGYTERGDLNAIDLD